MLGTCRMHSNRCDELHNLTREIDLNKNAAEQLDTSTTTLIYSDYVSLREANQDPDIGRFIKNRDSLYWIIRNRQENGLVDAGVVFKGPDKQWWIRKSAFLDWLTSDLIGGRGQ